MQAPKRNRQQDFFSPKEEKEPTLKLDEMIPIFQRLPTSELIRFISNILKHPLGKFWSVGLKHVVEKRLPFSIRATVAYGSNLSGVTTNIKSHVIYDCTGAKVAEIKRAELFHHSPLCELIEELEVPVQLHQLDGVNALLSRLELSALVNLKALSLPFVESNVWHPMNVPIHGSSLAGALTPELMSQIESLTLSIDLTSDRLSDAFDVLAAILPRAICLKRLSLTETQFYALLARHGHVFSGLESLTISLGQAPAVASSEGILAFIRASCTDLRELAVPVRGSIRKYFAAIETLPNLIKLALDGYNCKQKDLAVDANDTAVTSVLEFHLRLKPNSNDEISLLSMLSKLPNVRAFSIQTSAIDFAFRFAFAVCSSRVFRHLQTLRFSRVIDSSSYSHILQTIGAKNANFPATVDLSQMRILRDSCGPEFLVDLYREMEGNTISTLLFRATIGMDALGLLQKHLSLKGRTIQGVRVAKIIAWKTQATCNVHVNPFANDPQSTRYKIEGVKSSGPLRGATFNVLMYANK